MVDSFAGAERRRIRREASSVLPNGLRRTSCETRGRVVFDVEYGPLGRQGSPRRRELRIARRSVSRMLLNRAQHRRSSIRREFWFGDSSKNASHANPDSKNRTTQHHEGSRARRGTQLVDPSSSAPVERATPAERERSDLQELKDRCYKTPFAVPRIPSRSDRVALAPRPFFFNVSSTTLRSCASVLGLSGRDRSQARPRRVRRRSLRRVPPFLPNNSDGPGASSRGPSRGKS